MIALTKFLEATATILQLELNPPQRECVEHSEKPALMIVAGPGSGKTTVLVLRALRHLLVDGFQADSIVITTFTRKAAAELSSRLIAWGLTLIEHFRQAALDRGDNAEAEWLATLDVNAILAGTLDSFCQQWLASSREVGTPTPVMLEQFAAQFVYRRKIFSPAYSANKASYDTFLKQFTFEGQEPRSVGDASAVSTTINDRLLQDLVDLSSFINVGGAHAAQAGLLAAYRQHLGNLRLFDFSLCADHILARLRDGTLYPKLSLRAPIQALLVDEYQDTNPLQEAIYFELVKHSGCALAVVGDDDQALYRFRGATVELFTSFRARFETQVPNGDSHLVYLVKNRRSTPEIIQFFNTFITHDAGFTTARVAGKPAIEEHNPSRNVPVLGMFRESIDELAQDLAGFLHGVFRGPGVALPGGYATLHRDATSGDLGDAVLLTSSAREYKDSGSARLPSRLREALNQHDLGVFNPRGQDLRDIVNVQRLLGLVLLCLDPTDSIEAPLYITREARKYIPLWRDSARAFVATSPLPCTNAHSLQSFVDDWRARRPRTETMWPNEVPLLDLLYKLIVWIPEFQRDPEHQIYLEAIMRCVVQGSHYSAFGFSILSVPPSDARSRNSVVYDLLVPIADRVIDVDEDLLFAVPRTRLAIMTIHQAKGLEFPLVIVDVGSEFSLNHAKQAFKRFPRNSSSTVLMESAFARFTEVGATRTARSDLDRTFDDLARLYYVAYSRPKVALLLVGLTKNIEYKCTIGNVATFWSRNEEWSWRTDNPPLKKQTPTRPEHLPLQLI